MDGTGQDDWAENARMLVDSARAIVPADGSLERVRKARFHGAGFDRDVMGQASELGWLLMRVAEDRGGLGLGLRETCELMQVLGAGCVGEPILSSMLAATLLQDNLPEEVLTGESVIVTAWQDADGGFAGISGSSPLSGQKHAVPGLEGADLVAVVTDCGVAVVPLDAPGVSFETQELLDGCRSGTLTLQGVSAQVFPCDAAAALDEARLAQSAYLLGVSGRALDMTLDYLRVRKQFDKPIGSFQALQHRATEMKTQLELSRAGIMATARRFDTGADALARAQGAARCKHRAARVAMLIAREAVQMHGAMGITDEADIGLLVRKAMVEANRFGSARVQRQVLADLLTKEAA